MSSEKRRRPRPGGASKTTSSSLRLPALRQQQVTSVNNVELDVPEWHQSAVDFRELQQHRLQEQHQRRVRQTSAALDRVKMLRRARLHRMRVLDNRQLPDDYDNTDSRVSNRGDASTPVRQRKKHQPKTNIDKSQSRALHSAGIKKLALTKGPSLHSDTYRDVSEVQEYLNSFRSIEVAEDCIKGNQDGLEKASPLANPNKIPDFFLHQKQKEEQRQQDNELGDNLSESGGDDDDEERGNGIFGLTQDVQVENLQAGSVASDRPQLSPELGLLVVSDSTGDVRVETWQHDKNDQSRQQVPLPDIYQVDVAHAPAYSNQGKAYRKYRRLELDRIGKSNLPRESSGIVPRIGRTPHLPENMDLVTLEVDVVKEISVREELVSTCRKAFVGLVESVELIRGLKIQSEMLRTLKTIPGFEKTDYAEEARKAHPHGYLAKPLDTPRTRQKKVRATLAAQIAHLGEQQKELSRELLELRASTLKTANAIYQWRKFVKKEERRLQLDASFPIFDWHGENYLTKMQTDMNFLKGQEDPRSPSASPKATKAVNTFALEDIPGHRQSVLPPTIRFETPSHELVGKWIGFSPQNNPLLLPPKDHDPVAKLEAWTQLENERQLAEHQADIHKQIYLGLRSGKTAYEIFMSSSSCTQSAVENISKSSRGLRTSSVRSSIGDSALKTRSTMSAATKSSIESAGFPNLESSRFVHGLTIHVQVTGFETRRQIPSPRSARGFYESTHAQFSGFGRCPISPRIEVSVIDQPDLDDDVAQDSNDLPSLEKLTHKGDRSTSGKAVKTEFPETRGRAFDLRLTPKATIVPTTTDSSKIASYMSISSAIREESSAIESWKLEKAREVQRKLQAYDPMANIDARGGRDRAIYRYVHDKAKPDERDSLRQRAEHAPELAVNRADFELNMSSTTNNIQVIDKPAVNTCPQNIIHRNGAKSTLSFQSKICNVEAQVVVHCRAERIKLERQLSRLAGVKPEAMSTEDKQLQRDLQMKLDILRRSTASRLSDRKLLEKDRETELAEALAQEQAENAAVMVQSVVRMHHDRKVFLTYLDDQEHARKMTREEELMRSVEDVAATAIQVQFRGFLGRKIRQLDEATRLMAAEEQRKIQEAKDAEERKQRELEELQERGRQHRISMQQEVDQQMKQAALDAAERAQAARIISRGIRIRVDHKKQKQIAARKLFETRQDKAAILIQAHIRRMIVRIHAATLHAKERQRKRDEQARREAREQYARMYTSLSDSNRN